MVIEDFGLFRYLATNIPDVYLDDDNILFYPEGKNYGKEDCWSLLNISRSYYYLNFISYRFLF